jgi:hypothetical protein
LDWDGGGGGIYRSLFNNATENSDFFYVCFCRCLILIVNKWAHELNSFQKQYKWLNKHEEMFNILSYKGNANQNYSESPSHPSQNGHHQENKQQ